ncbi:MAG TPA: divalent-cation tolerance protein CutA [Planctomycetes bacterium]|nr:divalent-cation tolerance protein CutA [Planctomycetota bacterium]
MSDAPADAFVVLSTAPSEEEAAAIARALVDERLAACVQLVPKIRSFYRWEGEVHDDPEHLLVIKTTAARRDALIARIGELHSYDVPEAVALPIATGSQAYLAWLSEVTT